MISLIMIFTTRVGEGAKNEEEEEPTDNGHVNKSYGSTEKIMVSNGEKIKAPNGTGVSVVGEGGANGFTPPDMKKGDIPMKSPTNGQYIGNVFTVNCGYGLW